MNARMISLTNNQLRLLEEHESSVRRLPRVVAATQVVLLSDEHSPERIGPRCSVMKIDAPNTQEGIGALASYCLPRWMDSSTVA